MDYSLNMQEILRVLDISQAEMAMNLGISRQHMNNIIKGRSKFTNKLLYLLNKIYNVNLNFLFRGEGSILCEASSEQPLLEDVPISEIKPKSVNLTPRELTILRAISMGMSNNEISRNYVISLSTVKKHIASIMCKLNVKNRLQAAVVGFYLYSNDDLTSCYHCNTIQEKGNIINAEK